MTSPLTNAARVAADLRQRLAEIYGLDEHDEAIDDTVAGEGDLTEQIAFVARDALRAEAYAKGLAELIKTEQDRKARLEARAERLRNAVSWAMQEAGFKKLPLPDMSLSLSTGQRPLIIDEGEPIPDDFCHISRRVDRVKVREAIEDGEILSFARLGNPSPSLTIRRS